MNDTITIREPLKADETGWRRLWAGYNDFYQAQISDEITTFTWQRILNPHSPIFARMADVNGTLAGFSVSVLHDGTWVSDSICYLEDLFVEPNARHKGIGRQLIKDLALLGKAKGWARLYWNTKYNNPARQLYDEFVTADDFVRYRLDLRDQ